MIAWHVRSTLQKEFLKKVNFWPSYDNLSDLMPRQRRLSAQLADNRNLLKKSPNCTEIFWNDVKWRKGIKTHQIIVF